MQLWSHLSALKLECACPIHVHVLHITLLAGMTIEAQFWPAIQDVLASLAHIEEFSVRSCCVCCLLRPHGHGRSPWMLGWERMAFMH